MSRISSNSVKSPDITKQVKENIETNPFEESLRGAIESDNKWGRELKLSSPPGRKSSDQAVALLELKRPISGADTFATLKHITKAIFPALSSYKVDSDIAKVRVTVKGPDAPFVKIRPTFEMEDFYRDVKSKLNNLGLSEQQILLARMRLQGVDYHLGIVRARFREEDREKLSSIRESIRDKYHVHLRFEYLKSEPGSSLGSINATNVESRLINGPAIKIKQISRLSALGGVVESWEDVPFLSHDTRLKDKAEDMSNIESRVDGTKILRLCSPIALKWREYFRDFVPTLSIGMEAVFSPSGNLQSFKFMPVNAALWMPVNHQLCREINAKVDSPSVESAIRRSNSLGIDLVEQIHARNEMARIVTSHQLRLGRVVLETHDNSTNEMLISSERIVQRFLSFQDELFAKYLVRQDIPCIVKRHVANFETLIPKLEPFFTNINSDDLNDHGRRSLIVSVLRTRGQNELVADLARRVLGASGSYKPTILSGNDKLQVDDGAPAKVADKRDSDLAYINQMQLCLQHLNLDLLSDSSIQSMSQALIGLRSGVKVIGHSQIMRELIVLRKKIRDSFGMAPTYVT